MENKGIEEILIEFDDTITRTVSHFIKESGMPYHTWEDMVQEARLLIIEGIPKYDPDKSSPVTYISNLTRIACLRYRTYYYKLVTPFDAESEEEYVVTKGRGLQDFLDRLDTTELQDRILTDYSRGMNYVELSNKYNMSRRQIANNINDFKRKYLQSKK